MVSSRFTDTFYIFLVDFPMMSVIFYFLKAHHGSLKFADPWIRTKK